MMGGPKCIFTLSKTESRRHKSDGHRLGCLLRGRQFRIRAFTMGQDMEGQKQSLSK